MGRPYGRSRHRDLPAAACEDAHLVPLSAVDGSGRYNLSPPLTRHVPYAFHREPRFSELFPRQGAERPPYSRNRLRQQQSVSGNFVPIFLTDCTCFDIFRRYGFVFEYFPSPEKRMTYNGTMDWGRYAEKRLGLLIRKWGIAKMIVVGERTIMTDTPINLVADRNDGTQLVLAEVA